MEKLRANIWAALVYHADIPAERANELAIQCVAAIGNDIGATEDDLLRVFESEYTYLIIEYCALCMRHSATERWLLSRRLGAAVKEVNSRY